MFVTGLCFVSVTAIVKHVGDGLPAPQTAFLRYALGIVFVIPMLRPMIEAQLTRRQYWLFGARGAAHTVAVVLWFYAMTQITIAEVTAMNYLSPVYVTIGAALFLGERLAARRIAAVAVAFLGAMVILRPGFANCRRGIWRCWLRRCPSARPTFWQSSWRARFTRRSWWACCR